MKKGSERKKKSQQRVLPLCCYDSAFFSECQ